MNPPVDPNVTPSNPQDQLLYLLGGMNAKIDGIMGEQSAQRTEAAEFRAEVKTDVASLRSDLVLVSGRVDVIESKETPKAPWYAVVTGIVGIIGGTTGAIALINYLANLPQ